MTPDFWHGRWQRGEIGWHADAINRHLAQYWPKLAVRPGARVLVPLCGKSLDMLWLAARGHRVTGVELSRVAAEQFFRENDLGAHCVDLSPRPFSSCAVDEVELLCGDFFDLSPELLLEGDAGPLDAVYDRAALIALPPSMRPGYAAHLTRLLRTAGRPGMSTESLLISLEYDQGQMSGPPFAVSDEEIHALFEADFSIGRICSFNALSENPRFAQRGLTALSEHIYLLRLRT
jgi:thiopurine S-methyltransferase